ncbi:nucleotidyl transferase AbiEii/AbiGii toxin family protein [Ramlibacter sp.]|uniref:nucleotidyl transferase AbiEii/AbiGii toxin family protein n=1 Tax=Ramlibacter sp. TaxID=1917967 RepID=UPI003D11D156
MFERPHHRSVALVLQSLDAEALARHHCWFGGGTAMALLHGEYRKSVDIDFLVSDIAGYRSLRQMLGDTRSLTPIVRPGMTLEVAREIRADQYGIRTHIRVAGATIKFEIVLEGRIVLDMPSTTDVVCGVRTLTALDLAAEKLLANADRWADDAVNSRDLIDLAMHRAPRRMLLAACAKAEAPYGQSIRRSVSKAMDSLRNRPGRLEACIKALDITTVTRAQLWQAMKRIERTLAAPLP